MSVKCVECGNTKLIRDYKRCEIYCSCCGLVLYDSTLNILSAKPNNDKQESYMIRGFLENMNVPK